MCRFWQKVSKSRKQFLELSILPKNERNTWKNYPKSSQDNFFSCFVRCLEGLRISFFFEIYWPFVSSVLFNKKCLTDAIKTKRLIWWAYFKSSTYHAHAFSRQRCLVIKKFQSFSVDYYIMYSRHFFEDLTVDEAEHSKTPTTPVGLVLDSGAAEAMKIW